MIETPAEVIRVAGGRVWVRLSERQGGCGRCDEPGGCRSMRITDTFGKPDDVFSLESDLGVRVGERVRIAIVEGAPLRAALLSYGLAAVMMLVGAGVGTLLVPVQTDAAAALGMVAGLVFSYVVNRLLARSRNWRKGLNMTLLPDSQACAHAEHS